VVLDASDAPPEFHATFSARRKQYRYLIDNSPVGLPFLRQYAWQIRRPFDAQAMHDAAQTLLGTLDFRSFETDWPNKTTSVRTVTDLRVTRAPLWAAWLPRYASDDVTEPTCTVPPLCKGGVGGVASQATDIPAACGPPLICCEITADGFLYNMVRAIVGTLVNVGRGKWAIDDVARILREQRRAAAGATAPARGLYLARVDYS
jgi:tRNA pseudouridine38-40 synthase